MNVEELRGNLRDESILLAAPGKQLRQQAANYLEESLKRQQAAIYREESLKNRDESIVHALIDGSSSHLEASSKKIKEQEEYVGFLLEEMEMLENQPQTEVIKQRLQEVTTSLAESLNSIDTQRANLFSKEDYASYINITKEDQLQKKIKFFAVLLKSLL